MVTFTCQNCNSCLKKKAVDNHLFKCRSTQLTCIDCLKDFDSHNYVGHVSCVTEDQRYGGKDFALTNSMLKQNQWNQCISQLLQKSLSPKVIKDIMVYASENPNCPRNKKKFLNFVLNNKNFKSKEPVEKAFDLIQEEFNKINSVNDQSKNIETSGNKRKTISETEVQDADNLPTSNDKLSKKKNKKINCENGDVETVSENGLSNPKKNEKKGKKNNSESVKEDVDKSNKNGLDNVNEEENKQNGDSHIAKDGKKKKKNKKERKNSIVEQSLPKSNEDILDDNVDEQENVQTESNGVENGSSELHQEDLSKLSKKERKKLLKQKKYEAEIVSIENYKKEDNTPVVEEETEKPKKKKKKQAEEEANRVQKSSISEPEDKKIKLEVDEVQDQEIVEVEKPKKFKWDEIIIQVLQSQGDGEMSLKRLAKKVCGEYANVYGERESYEEVLLKFNKKVLRTHGVRVLKDKAKLLMDS